MVDFDSIVFSGGGSRCLWQVGFFEELLSSSDIKPKSIAAVSAGATMACLVLTGKVKRGLDYFKEVTSRNRKNAYWSNLVKNEPVFPHYHIYRKAIFDLIDEDDLGMLKKGPEIRVLIAQPPKWLGARTGTFVGLLAYSVEKKLFYPVHPKFASYLGFKPLVEKVQNCNSVEDLANLLLQSSCTPPFVPVLKRNSRPALDGGLIDNVPLGVLSGKKGSTLVMLSRQYPVNKIPIIEGVTYVQPSKPITIDKWDYTNPEGLQVTYDLGKRDAVKFFRKV